MSIAEQDLRESATKYRAIFDLANDAIFLHDAATGVIVDVNPKTCEMYGYSREETLRLSVADLSADQAPYTQEQALSFVRAAAAGVPQLFEWYAKDRRGRCFWVEVSLQRVPMDEGDRLLAIVRDITDRKRVELEIRVAHETQKTLNALLRLALDDMELEELLQRALALVLNNPWPVTSGRGAIFLADASGTLLSAAHIGLSAPERAGCNCGEHDYCIPIAAGGTKLGSLKVFLRADHRVDASEAEFLDIFAATLAGIIVRKRAEDDLREADDRLREQAALVRLGEMAAVVAHEVRNPLAGVRGAIQVIGSRLRLEPGDAAVFGEVIARLDALDELMTDLLMFARPPQANFVPVDVVSLAKETSDLVARDANARNVRFLVEGASAAIKGDPKLLRSVLLNLLLNAAHAVQNDGTVRTSVVSTDDRCLVAVSDTGPGIPPEVRDRIFVPFFTTKSRGTGLGLPTAKRLVEAHRGRITVDCPASGGTTVTIELPRA